MATPQNPTLLNPSFHILRLSDRVVCYALRDGDIIVTLALTLRADFSWTISGIGVAFGAVTSFLAGRITSTFNTVDDLLVPPAVRSYLEGIVAHNLHISLELGRPFHTDIIGSDEAPPLPTVEGR